MRRYKYKTSQCIVIAIFEIRNIDNMVVKGAKGSVLYFNRGGFQK